VPAGERAERSPHVDPALPARARRDHSGRARPPPGTAAPGGRSADRRGPADPARHPPPRITLNRGRPAHNPSPRHPTDVPSGGVATAAGTARWNVHHAVGCLTGLRTPGYVARHAADHTPDDAGSRPPQAGVLRGVSPGLKHSGSTTKRPRGSPPATPALPAPAVRCDLEGIRGSSALHAPGRPEPRPPGVPRTAGARANPDPPAPFGRAGPAPRRDARVPGPRPGGVGRPRGPCWGDPRPRARHAEPARAGPRRHPVPARPGRRLPFARLLGPALVLALWWASSWSTRSTRAKVLGT